MLTIPKPLYTQCLSVQVSQGLVPGEGKFLSAHSNTRVTYMFLQPTHIIHCMLPLYMRAIAAIIQFSQSIFTYWGQTFWQDHSLYHSQCGRFTSLNGFCFYPEKNSSFWGKNVEGRCWAQTVSAGYSITSPWKSIWAFILRAFLGGSEIAFSCCRQAGRNKQWRACLGYQAADAWLRSWKSLLRINYTSLSAAKPEI